MSRRNGSRTRKTARTFSELGEMDWRAERDTTVAREVATFPTPKIAPDNAIERIRHLEAQQKKLWSRKSVIVVASLTAATFWSIGFYVGLVVGRAHW